MPETLDTSTEAVGRMARTFDGDPGGPECFAARVGSTLRALAAERDDYRTQLARATDPAYLTEALAKIGAVDPGDHAAALARAESAERERDALMVVARAARQWWATRSTDDHLALGRAVLDASSVLPPGMLDQPSGD